MAQQKILAVYALIVSAMLAIVLLIGASKSLGLSDEISVRRINILEPDGPPCYCGKNGCIEKFLSGSGLIHAYRESGGDGVTDSRSIVTKAEQGDAVAEAAMRRFLDRFGHALSIVVNILDPDIVVLGGGMSNIGRLYTEGTEALARHVFNDELLTRVVQNRHGDSAGVRGAAWLWPV